MFSLIKTKSKKPKAILLSMVIFNTAALILTSSSFAWFVSKKNENVDPSNAKSGLPELSLNLTLFKYNDDHQIISSNDPKDLTLNKYDGFIPEKNVYNALILRFDITGSLISEAKTTMYLDIECTKEAYNTQFISNVIEFSIDPLLISSTDNTTIYQTALEALTTSDTFVSISTDGTITKKTIIEKTIDLSSCTDLIHNGAISVYMKIDYSEKLIETNFSDITVSTETSGVEMHFDNDIAKIYINSKSSIETV